MRVLIICGLLLASCQAPDPTFVQSARDFHDAVAPEYLDYVHADAGLTAEQKSRRESTVQRFLEAIEIREKVTK